MKVPADIDERLIEHFAPKIIAGVKPDEDLEVAALVDAVRATRMAAQSIAEFEESATADASMTETAASIAVRDFAVKAASHITPKLDAARTKVASVLKQIESETASPPAPRDAATLGLEAEIRSRLSGMRDEKRSATIKEAFANKDMHVIGAVLRTPPFLSGLSTEQHAVHRSRYRREHHGAYYARHERLTKALERFDGIGRLFFNTLKDVTTTKNVQKALDAKERRTALQSGLEAGE